jgi:hypothetical protein
MKIKVIVSVTALIFLLSSCSMILPLTATSNSSGTKVGTSVATSVFGLCFGGDASIRTAAKNGGITKISTVDMQKTNTLFIITKYTTIVTGE